MCSGFSGYTFWGELTGIFSIGTWRHGAWSSSVEAAVVPLGQRPGVYVSDLGVEVASPLDGPSKPRPPN